MSKILGLINLKGTYAKMNKEKREIYYNDKSNNLIVFSPMGDETTVDICNGIAEENYNYIINFLNNSYNVIVYWSKFEGVTSDYIIYEDLVPSDLKGLEFNEVQNKLIESIVSGDIQYKYIVVRNGIASKIE